MSLQKLEQTVNNIGSMGSPDAVLPDVFRRIRRYPQDYKLTADVKNRWLKLLRSGDVNQATGRLLNIHNNSMCCLGVLADSQGAERCPPGILHGSIDAFLLPYSDTGNTKKQLHRHTNTVPDGYAGMKSEMIELCWRMNDNLKFSFSEIADVIEELF